MHPQSPCPCGSPHSYAACCQPLHQGQPATSAEVQFVARWADASGVAQAHREHSAFVRKQQRWYFIDPGVALNHGRNEPCPCGSGRKFKQCCNPR